MTARSARHRVRQNEPIFEFPRECAMTMQLIHQRAYARAGLIGNPSDGYHGKTISVIVRNFWAETVLYEWDEVEVVWSREDRSRFRTVDDLVRDVQLHGYYGGVRLVKATIKKFVDYCRRTGRRLHDRNFSIRYDTNIPRAVGLAGSSAIIIATLRSLMRFYEVDIPLEVQPSLALSVETDELGIAAGLQDRVIQVYEGAVHMDFDRQRMRQIDGFSCGVYTPLSPSKLPPLYLAFSAEVGEPTEVVHNDLRARYDRGDAQVHAAMRRFAAITDEAAEAIEQQDHHRLDQLINENFDLRRSICQIPAGQLEMIERARAAGCSAKFAGSGGAIIGICADDSAMRRLRDALEPDFRVLRPRIFEP